MKTIIVNLFLLILSCNVLLAQPNKAEREARREKLEAAKIALITERLNLKPEQAEKFWPVYNQHLDTRMELQKRRKKLRQHEFSFTASDEELKAAIDEMFQIKEEELESEKKTRDELLKILSVRQLAELYRTEQEFIRRMFDIIREGPPSPRRRD